MDSEPSPINWIDDSSKPPGSFVHHQGFTLVKLNDVCTRLISEEMPNIVSFYCSPKLHSLSERMKYSGGSKAYCVRHSTNSSSFVICFFSLLISIDEVNTIP